MFNRCARSRLLACALAALGALASAAPGRACAQQVQRVDGAPFSSHPLVTMAATYMDDGAFNVSAETREDRFWVPALHYVIWGRIEEGDRLRVVLKQRGRTIADFDCRLYAASELMATQREQRCTPDGVQLTQSGDITGEIAYVGGSETRERFHVFSMQVRRIPREGRGFEFSVIPADTGAMAWVGFNIDRDDGSLLGMELYFWRQAVDSAQLLRDARMQCSVDGRPVQLGEQYDPGTVYSVEYRVSPTEERVLQLVNMRTNLRVAEMRRHPGRWECVALEGRDVLRAVRFQVDAEGIPYHAVQTAERPLRLHPEAVFVEVDSSRTTRAQDLSDPAASSRTTMFGQAWPGGRASWFGR